MLSRLRERGDTLIEVLFAVSVFSFVVVGALVLMNQGTAASQRSLEITLVRQQIDAQAEVLRYMHDSYVAVYHPGITFDTNDVETSPAEEWYKMITDVQAAGATAASTFSVNSQDCPAFPPNAFVVDPLNARYVNDPTTLQPATTFAQVTHDDSDVFTGSQGLWVEAIRSAPSADADQSNTGFVDFHIRACWPGTGLPVAATQGTIVRLYEPRG